MPCRRTIRLWRRRRTRQNGSCEKKHIIRMGSYKVSDADTILSRCQDEKRFGFVIVNPHKRGKGYGKDMLRLITVIKQSVLEM